MRENSGKPNVFVVDTPYQLLNAIEARHSFQLSNSHLIIMVGRRGRAPYEPLISKKDWVRVHYISLIMEDPGWRFKIFGPRVAEKVLDYCWVYREFLLRRRLDEVAKSVKTVDNLFLGHYWAEYKPYLRHFANTLKHTTLYLLDDGTDTIDINNRRKSIDRSGCKTPPITVTEDKSLWKRIKTHLRRKYIDFDNKEAESVTFFTTYDLNVRDGDHLVRNEYRYLRSLAAASTRMDEVYFLGQCFVDDGDMEEEFYLEYLKKVKVYFQKEKVKYVPHPRESLRMINKIRESLGFEIKKSGVPIEYEIMLRGQIPKILAGFSTSALESCSNILRDNIKIISFYLYPEHLIKSQDSFKWIYEYFEKKVSPNFKIIRLDFDDRQRRSRPNAGLARVGG